MPKPEIPDRLRCAPFTRDTALAAGLSDRMLQSSPWRRIFNGVWVHDELPDSRELRLAAAKLLIPACGVLCGLTAAWVAGVDVRRLDDLDVHAGFPKGKRIRKRPGVAVCQETLDPSDIVVVDGVGVTTSLRTAFDCLRWLPYAEGIVVADALSHDGLITVEDLAAYFAGKRRLRNLRIGERLVGLVEPLTESPMETRLRVTLVVEGGLPAPVAQHVVHDRQGYFVGRLDLAYPEHRLGVEYDGVDHHWNRRREDERRRAALRACGWEILVYTADDLFQTPLRTIAQVTQALRARAA